MIEATYHPTSTPPLTTRNMAGKREGGLGGIRRGLPIEVTPDPDTGRSHLAAVLTYTQRGPELSTSPSQVGFVLGHKKLLATEGR